MLLSSESSERVLVLSVAGRLDFSTSNDFLRSLEAAVVAAKGRPLIVDCSGLDYVSSTGLRSFLIGARAAQAAGVRFLVCGLRSMISDVFQVSGFAKVIPILPDRAAAEAEAAT